MARLSRIGGLVLGLALVAPGGPVAAQEARDADALFDLLRMPETVQIMAEEGIASGSELAVDLGLPEDDPAFLAAVAGVYDAARMEAEARATFVSALEGQDLGPLFDYFGSEGGAVILELDISARRAIMDEDVERIAKENAAVAFADETPRADQIARLVEATDMVELNVAAGMNSNLAYYMGMLDSGAFAGQMTVEDVLTEVLNGEESLRGTMTEWAHAFLFLAYGPLSDEDLESLIAIAQTREYRLVNAALFRAFDDVLEPIARELGRISGRTMAMTEL